MGRKHSVTGRVWGQVRFRVHRDLSQDFVFFILCVTSAALPAGKLRMSTTTDKTRSDKRTIQRAAAPFTQHGEREHLARWFGHPVQILRASGQDAQTDGMEARALPAHFKRARSCSFTDISSFGTEFGRETPRGRKSKQDNGRARFEDSGTARYSLGRSWSFNHSPRTKRELCNERRFDPSSFILHPSSCSPSGSAEQRAWFDLVGLAPFSRLSGSSGENSSSVCFGLFRFVSVCFGLF